MQVPVRLAAVAAAAAMLLAAPPSAGRSRPMPPVVTPGAALPSAAVAPGPGLASRLAYGAEATGRDDLDGDGRPDGWRAQWEGGSGAGGIVLRVTPGRGGPPVEVDTRSSFGSFLALAILPRPLASPEAARAVAALFQGTRGVPAIADGGGGVGGAFAWLVDFHRTPAAARAPFLEVRAYTPRWAPGPPQVPGDEAAWVRGKPLAALAASLAGIGSAPATAGPRDAGLVLHLGHNHQAIARVAACGPLEVWATAHGVAVRDTGKDASSWAYVSTGVTKLRWPSLVDAACAGDLVFAERAADGVRDLWVVDPIAGRLGRLRLEDGLDWELDAATGDLVLGGRDGGPVRERLPLARVREALGRR